MQEEDNNIRQLAEFSIFFGNMKKAQQENNPEAEKKAREILDEHMVKMRESIEISKREIAQAQLEQPGRTFSQEEVAQTYRETLEDTKKEISKLKKSAPPPPPKQQQS
jgi:uncharacterized protein (DUF2267 family)